MESSGSLLVSVMVMVAVVATLVRDLLVSHRGYRVPSGPGPRASHEKAPRPVERPAPVPAGHALAGAPGDVDPTRELCQHLAALKLLGLDHVRIAHPLFRTQGEPLVSVAERPDAAPSSEPARRRHRRPALASGRRPTALRLVVDRR